MNVVPARLKKRSDFVALRQGVKVVKPAFIVAARLTDRPAGACRFGFTVTKKTASKATERNLIKRRLRHIVQHSPLLGGEVLPIDCVVIARQGVTSVKFSVLQRDFEKALKRLFFMLKPAQVNDRDYTS